MILRRSSLSANIVQFCRYLRQHHYPVGAEEEAISLQALLLIDYRNPAGFFLALKATLCKSKTQVEEFETFFNEYWKEERKALDSKIKTRPLKAQPAISQPPSFKSLKTWLHGNRNEETEETATYSYHESLCQKNFSSIPDEDVDELMMVIKDLAKKLAAQRKRRYTSSEKNILLDLRRTLRQNLRRGGELLELAWRKRKRNRVKLVLLCDVSKSMELYTSFLIQFMFAFQQFKEIETFTFGTTLKSMTSFLKDKNFHDSLHSLTMENDGWEGGTRIGESLDTFVKTYSKKMLDSKTVVIILSDGWDKGSTELLKTNMQFIQKNAKKVIWLNPLAGFESFRPEVVGMQTAMPFIDVFASVHNVESLRRLSKWI